MFKEKHLIFRGLENGNGPKTAVEKPKAIISNPNKELADNAADMGDLLTTETDAIIAEVERESEIKNEKITKQSEKYFAEEILPELRKKYPNLSDIYLTNSDLVKKDILAVLKKGYEMGKPYKFYINKEGWIGLVNPAKGVSEVRFEFNRYDQKLNYPKAKTLEQKYFDEQILPIIKDFKPDYKLMTTANNFLINEHILPVLAEGYKLNDPYKVVGTEAGFKLVNSRDTQDFDLDGYDDDLEPIVSTKQKVEPKEVAEDHGEDGPEEELHERLREIAKTKFKEESDALASIMKDLNYKHEEGSHAVDLLALKEPTPDEVSKMHQQMDNIIAKSPVLKELGDSGKALIALLEEQKKAIQTGEAVEEAQSRLDDWRKTPESEILNKYEDDEDFIASLDEEDQAALKLYWEYATLLVVSQKVM